MTAEQKRVTIGRWVEAGLPWRSWSVFETTCVLYRQLVSDLFESEQFDDLRAFLKLAGDKVLLGALDRETMNQTGKVGLTDMGVARG